MYSQIVQQNRCIEYAAAWGHSDMKQPVTPAWAPLHQPGVQRHPIACVYSSTSTLPPLSPGSPFLPSPKSAIGRTHYPHAPLMGCTLCVGRGWCQGDALFRDKLFWCLLVCHLQTQNCTSKKSKSKEILYQSPNLVNFKSLQNHGSHEMVCAILLWNYQQEMFLDLLSFKFFTEWKCIRSDCPTVLTSVRNKNKKVWKWKSVQSASISCQNILFYGIVSMLHTQYVTSLRLLICVICINSMWYIVYILDLNMQRNFKTKKIDLWSRVLWHNTIIDRMNKVSEVLETFEFSI